jgi:hypothetical protein
MSRLACVSFVLATLVALLLGQAGPGAIHAQGRPAGPNKTGAAPAARPWRPAGGPSGLQRPAAGAGRSLAPRRVSFRALAAEVAPKPAPASPELGASGPDLPLLPADWRQSAGHGRAATATGPAEMPATVRPRGATQDTEPRVEAWTAFDGQDSTWLPAEPALAVGLDHVVGAVNSAFGVFDKQGRPSAPPIDLADWYGDLLGDWAADFMVSAPALVYDPADDRYVMAAVANDRDSGQSVIALSVSSTDDPTGDWCVYGLDPALTGSSRLPLMASQATLGVNRDTLYLTADLFEAVDNGQYQALNFDHARAFFLSKSIYYQPGCAAQEAQSWYRFSGLVDADGQPARALRAAPNLDGTPDAYLVGTDRDGGTTLSLWRARTQAGSVPVDGNLTVQGLTVAPFDVPADAPQADSPERIDTGDASPASAVQVDGNLWVAHTIGCAGPAAACVQWYQIAPALPDLLRSERRGLPDGALYYPALMPDAGGEPVLVQNASSATDYLGLRYGDGAENLYAFQPGTPGSGEACYDDGRGAGPSLWGFHNAVALDPDRGTVWAHAAYAGGLAYDCTRNDWRTAVLEIDWPNRPSETRPTPTTRPSAPTPLPTEPMPEPTSEPTPAPTEPRPEPPSGWSIGMPVVTNRLFRGQYLGNGDWVERGASISGHGISGIQVQNLDGNGVLDATARYHVQRDPYEADRTEPPAAYDVELKGVPAGGSANMYLPKVNLPGGMFSVDVGSHNDLLTAAIARTDWSTGGAALYSNVDFADRIVVPLALRHYVGQTSIIAVMAAGNERPIRARLDLQAAGSAEPIPGPSFDLAPYESLVFDLNDALAVFEDLGEGFVGSATITAQGGRIGAVSYVYSVWSDTAVSAFEGVPATSASNTLFAPLFRANQRGIGGVGRLDTGMSVVNPMDHPVEVTVTYFPTDSLAASAACRSQAAYAHGPIRIPASSSHVFYQGPRGDHGLPDDCFGSALIRAEDPADRILAIVNDSTDIVRLTAAYNALPAERAHTKVALPLFRNRHLPQELTTGIQVMNAGDLPARVEISFTTSEGANLPGCGADCVAVIEPWRSTTWYPPTMPAIPAGIYGSAVVKSDEPVLVIVNDYPLRATLVDAAIYNGIPVFDREVEPGTGARAEPQ